MPSWHGVRRAEAVLRLYRLTPALSRPATPAMFWGDALLVFVTRQARASRHFCDELIGSRAGRELAEKHVFFAIFFNHDTGTLSGWQADIDKKDGRVTHAWRDVSRQVQ
jgi:hypothetical protein